MNPARTRAAARRFFYAPALALVPAVAAAQAPPRVGALQVQNNLSEIAAGGPSAQAAARVSLGVGVLSTLGVGTGLTSNAGQLSVLYGTAAGTALQGSVLGVPNGVASLDTSGLVPLTQVPTIPSTRVSGLAPSATTDTTNAANITAGTLPAARLPTPTVSTLGGALAFTAPAHQFLTGIGTSGAPVAVQPVAADVAGLGGAATLNVGSIAGTVAAGDDSRINGALQTSAIPLANLLGGTGSALAGVTVSTGLTLSAGALTANVQSVAGRTGAVVLSTGDISGFAAAAAAAAPVQTVAGRTGAVTLAAADISGLAASATTDATNATNIATGTLGAARLPLPTATTLGGVESAAPVSHQFVTGISTAGVPSLAQPSTGDISGFTSAAAAAAPVQTVAGRTGAVTLGVSDVTGAAPLASPALTGTPTAPTALTTDSSTALATTAFVKALGYVTSAGAASAAPVQSVAGRTGAVTISLGDVSGAGSIASQSAGAVSITGGTVSGADTSAANATATGAFARTLAAHFSDVANVADFLPGATDEADAITRAFNSLPAAGGIVQLQAGSFSLPTCITLTGKPVWLRGRGQGQTTLTSACATTPISITETSISAFVETSDFTLQSSASAAVPDGIAVSWPSTASWPQSTLTVDHVQIVSALGAGATTSPYPGTFESGISISNAWTAFVNHYTFTGINVQPSPFSAGGAVSIDGKTIGLYVDKSLAYYGANFIRQNAYAEGIGATGNVVVGTDYFFTQGSGITANGSGLYGVSFALHDNEINTGYSGVVVQKIGGGFIDGQNNFSPYLTTGNPWVGIDATDTNNWTIEGNNFGGDASRTTFIAYRLQVGTLSSTSNVFTGNNIVTGGTCVSLGASTAFNVVAGNACTNATGTSNAYVDSGVTGDNTVRWPVANSGAGGTVEASAANWYLGASDGSIQFGVSKLLNAKNYPLIIPGAAGNAPQIKFIGTDTNVAGRITAQGSNGITLENGDGVLAAFGQAQVGTVVNEPLIEASTAGNSVIYTAVGTDANISATLQAKGLGVVAATNGNGTLGWFQQQGSGAIANFPVLQAASAGTGINIGVTGSDTNIPIAFTPKGNGAAGAAGHIANFTRTGYAPTPSACGTSPALDTGATDTKGTVTEGTTATGCTLTFGTAYLTAPECVISSPNGAVATGYSVSTTALTITNASASGDKFTYVCVQ